MKDFKIKSIFNKIPRKCNKSIFNAHYIDEISSDNIFEKTGKTEKTQFPAQKDGHVMCQIA
jgi:hypothetical protein